MPPKQYASITEYLQHCDPEIKPTIAYLCELFAGIDAEIKGQIKWNSPAFEYTGDMKPFDPKEYKRDIVVFNARKGKPVLLVFPSGNRIPISASLGDENKPDGRKMVSITSLEDAQSKSTELVRVVKAWLDSVV